MNAIKRAGLGIAAIAILGLATAACGNSEAASGGGSGGSSSVNPGGGGSPDGDSREVRAAALVKYAQCMRENGVSQFPDPVDGRLQLKAERGGALDPDSPAFQEAQKKCKSVEPPGLLEGKGVSGDQQEQMLKYVACMRKNGVPNFPDPQNGRIQLSPEVGVDPQSPQFKNAEDACRKFMPGGVSPGGV
ncbi:hypothetical protein ABGB18_39945 [Nonomuraea sp. B12E4]|uniref:hypothetical protein n=1 Tax=Nonomuraea sp. B12E4 TaxID=3153564 RepID=UPI00325DEA36